MKKDYLNSFPGSAQFSLREITKYIYIAIKSWLLDFSLMDRLYIIGIVCIWLLLVTKLLVVILALISKFDFVPIFLLTLGIAIFTFPILFFTSPKKLIEKIAIELLRIRYLSTIEKLYSFFCIVLIIIAFTNQISQILLVVINMSCWFTAFIMNLVSWGKKLLSNETYKTVFKFSLGLLYVTSIFFSSIISNKIINDYMGIEPSKFPNSQKVMIITSSLLVWLCIVLIGVSLAYTIAVSAMMLGIVFIPLFTSVIDTLKQLEDNILSRATIKIDSLKSQHDNVYFPSNLFIALGKIALPVYLSYLLLIPSISTVLYFYQNHFPIKYFNLSLVSIDYHDKRNECKNIKVGERAITINGDKINVAIPNNEKGYVFETRKCQAPS